MLIVRFTLFMPILFFILSCNKEPPTEATSGVAQVTAEVYSKTCSNGSLRITKETTAVEGAPAILDVDDLPVGAEVSVSGAIANGGICGFTGSVSFSCKATVRIDLNKTFYCTAENHISGATNVNTAIYSDLGYSSTGSRSLISGEFHTYYGGNNTFVSLQVSSSSPLVPAPCKLSFICQ